MFNQQKLENQVQMNLWIEEKEEMEYRHQREQDLLNIMETEDYENFVYSYVDVAKLFYYMGCLSFGIPFTEHPDDIKNKLQEVINNGIKKMGEKSRELVK